MTLDHDGECALDDLWEAYHAAVGELDREQGDLRAQVGRAVAWVRKHRKLCGVKPTDAFEGDVLGRLFRVLEAGTLVKTLSVRQQKKLASDIRAAEKHLHKELTARVETFWDEEVLGWRKTQPRREVSDASR